MAYRQLTLEQRYLIYKLRKEGYSQAGIAKLVHVHRSTISRELRRNVNRKGYRPKIEVDPFSGPRPGQSKLWRMVVG